MDNKLEKNKFLESVILMYKEGEISENALTKIKDLYYKEHSDIQLEKISSEEFIVKKQNPIDSDESRVLKNVVVSDNLVTEGANKKNINANQSEIYKRNNPFVHNTLSTKSTNNNNKINNRNEQGNKSKEHNITIILSLGIILILLAGIILATSTWDLMSNGVKTAALSMISIIFFIMSNFTEKKLKIIKTSFAFWILGILFLPVILLSIGYFGLLGNYLSIDGEGRYIYGIISAIICSVFFSYSIKKYKKSEFTWITLLDIQIIYWCILQHFEIGYNTQILMLIIYTVLLTGVYYKLVHNKIIYNFVVNAIKWYALINLIINSLQVLGNIIYTIFMKITSQPLGIFQGMIMVCGIIILSGIITFWTYEFKFRGSILSIGALIIALEMICVIFKVEIDEPLYYLIMNIGLLLIYGIFYYWNNFRSLNYIKFGTDLIVIATMALLDIISKVMLKPVYTALSLYVLTTVILVTSRKEKDSFYLPLLKYGVPCTVFIANFFTFKIFGLMDNLFSIKRFHEGLIFIIMDIAIIYGISFILRIKNNGDYKTYLYNGHVFLGLTYIYSMIFQVDRMIVEGTIIIVSAVCLWIAGSSLKIRVYLYCILTMITILLFDLEIFLELIDTGVAILEPQNLLLLMSLFLTIVWWLSSEFWREYLNIYLYGIYSIGFLSSLGLNNFHRIDYMLVSFIIGSTVIMWTFLDKIKKSFLMPIPIASFWILSFRIIYYYNDISQIVASIIVAFILIIIGYAVYRINKNILVQDLLSFNIFAGLSLLNSVLISFESSTPYVYNIITLMIFGFFLLYSSRFLENLFLKKVLSIACVLFNYSAYGRFILELNFIDKFRLEFLFVPSIIILKLVMDHYLEKKAFYCSVISTTWYCIVGFILLFFNSENNEFHAITFCALCIISIILGFKTQNKLYFLGGVSFLIIGVFLNTLSFWLSIPWWIYLLVGGTVLIFFASKNEFGKSKDNKKSIVYKIFETIRKWDSK